MTNGEELILKELAKLHDLIGDIRVDIATVTKGQKELEKRVTTMESVKWRLFFAILTSGAIGAGGSTLAQALGM